MGIKFYCPNGHKLHVKSFLAGKRGVCPHCDASVIIPLENQIPSGKRRARSATQPAAATDEVTLATSGPSLATSGSSYAGPPFLGPPSDAGVSTAAGRNGSAVAYASAPFAVPVNASGPAVSVVQPPGPMSSSRNPLGIAAAPLAHAAAIPTGSAVEGLARSAWDPVAEAPEAVWFVRPPSGGQFGPARGEIMRKWITEGRVTADSMVWREGWSDWRDAGPVFPELPAPPELEPGLDFPGPATLTRSTDSESTTSRVPLRSRRRKSPAMAIATVTVLVLVSLGLLITLVYVLNNG